MKSTSMIAALGASLWIVSEIVERASGGISGPSLIVTAAAFAALAVGAWGIDGAAPPTRGWRVAVAFLSVGFALMAALSVAMWSVGAGAHEETPLFFAAVGVFTIGVLAVGGVATWTARHPRWVGAAFLAVSLVSLGANAAEVGLLASVTNVAMSALLIAMARPGLRVTAPAAA